MHLHKWSKWGLPVATDLKSAGIGCRLVQWRRCKICGVIKSRGVRSAGIPAESIIRCLDEEIDND